MVEAANEGVPPPPVVSQTGMVGSLSNSRVIASVSVSLTAATPDCAMKYEPGEIRQSSLLMTVPVPVDAVPIDGK